MSRPDLLARLALASEERARNGLLRRMRTITAIDGAHVVIDGRRLRNFASNDYLGLAGNPEISKALAEGAAQWGAGSGASHLVSGHLAPHEALEKLGLELAWGELPPGNGAFSVVAGDMLNTQFWDESTGEVMGVAGVAGNGQSELLEVLAGIRAAGFPLAAIVGHAEQGPAGIVVE